ncbi:hypothetical protein BIFGAL_03488 [Bifidobacterium gallicum DSM 20093 = LMG 11596]|uniref:Uncharacterized protein n=1 Tax=Bifidobacterium gallicum DSM 20093 = LMG 11596 TaxID=561180 RepID=D1NUG5_9BIFI|nr:hypothetical protein BIFGAL_03488 [Bifidobacterium gallicum DSM 20093 = LMG 11596]
MKERVCGTGKEAGVMWDCGGAGICVRGAWGKGVDDGTKAGCGRELAWVRVREGVGVAQCRVAGACVRSFEELMIVKKTRDGCVHVGERTDS